MRLAAAILLGAAAVAAQQAPTRDLQRTAPAGTGSISGVIETDDAQHKPLRRAKVMLNSPDLPVGRTVVTNDAGTFVVERLPAGRYTIGAMKDGYVSMAYGATRPGRPGRPFALADGEAKRMTLRLPRGAVITGTIVDSEGQPSPGVQVTAGYYRWANVSFGAGPVIVSAGAATTDDRGVYRIFGLPAGDYLVAAQVRLPGQPTGFISTSTVDVVSDAEIRRALAEPRPSSRPTGELRGPAAQISSAEEPRRALSLAPIYFPGVPSEARATPVSVSAAEERGGIDMQLQYVATTAVRVTVTGGGGPMIFLQTIGQALSGIVANARPDSEGRYTFTSVRPGSYRVSARSPIQPGPGSAVPQAPALWASSEIAVNGEESLEVVLALQPGLTISGRMAFDGTRTALPMMPGLSVTLPARNSVFGSLMPALPPLRIEAGGRFTISEVPPGPYRFENTVPGLRTAIAGWWLQSIAVGGRDLLDGQVELRQSVDDAVITFTDRATELAGKVTDAKGSPSADATVVIFATDSSAWFVNSRRVAGIRTGAGGRYTIANLPAGDYFVAVSDDVDPGEWNDPALLQRISRGAVRIRLGAFEKKTQDLIVDRQ